MARMQWIAERSRAQITVALILAVQGLSGCGAATPVPTAPTPTPTSTPASPPTQPLYEICAFAVPADQQAVSIGVDGGQFSFSVETQPACTWSVDSKEPGITSWSERRPQI